MLKSSVVLFCSSLNLCLFDLIIWESSNSFLWDRDLGTCPLSPKTNIIYLWRPQDTSNHLRKNNSFLEHVIVGNIKISGIHKFECFGKEVHHEKSRDACNKLLKSWMWDQYIPTNMQWQFGKSLKCETFETNNLWKEATSKPINFETKKRWNRKPRK